MHEKCEIIFSVSGAPVGKQRPRMTKRGHTYTPQKTVDAEKRVSAAAWQAMVLAGYTVTAKPVVVTLEIEAPIPKSWTKRDKLAAELNAIKPSRPDLDNVLKLVLDACNRLVYHDDAQVHHAVVSKKYGAGEGRILVKMEWPI